MTVQARLDPQARKTLTRLVRELGLTPSEVVREGLRALGAVHPRKGKPRIAGLAQFDSGIPDLGSNKKHLKGFGR